MNAAPANAMRSEPIVLDDSARVRQGDFVVIDLPEQSAPEIEEAELPPRRTRYSTAPLFPGMRSPETEAVLAAS